MRLGGILIHYLRLDLRLLPEVMHVFHLHKLCRSFSHLLRGLRRFLAILSAKTPSCMPVEMRCIAI